MKEVINNTVKDRKLSMLGDRDRSEESPRLAHHPKYIGGARPLIYIWMAASTIGPGARMLVQGLFVPGHIMSAFVWER